MAGTAVAWSSLPGRATNLPGRGMPSAVLALLVPALLLERATVRAQTACELAIVGGGPGGLYTAWRLAVDTKTVKPSDICVFERAERVGGRTFSVRNQGTKKDLVVDLGAYRFCRSPNATDCNGTSRHACPTLAVPNWALARCRRD